MQHHGHTTHVDAMQPDPTAILCALSVVCDFVTSLSRHDYGRSSVLNKAQRASTAVVSALREVDRAIRLLGIGTPEEHDTTFSRFVAAMAPSDTEPGSVTRSSFKASVAVYRVLTKTRASLVEVLTRAPLLDIDTDEGFGIFDLVGFSWHTYALLRVALLVIFPDFSVDALDLFSEFSAHMALLKVYTNASPLHEPPPLRGKSLANARMHKFAAVVAIEACKKNPTIRFMCLLVKELAGYWDEISTADCDSD